MTNILLHGACGRMGRAITALAAGDDSIRITAGVDSGAATCSCGCDFPVYASLKEVQEKADVIIDFSTAAAMDDLLSFVEEKSIPCVLCTTGLSEEQTARAEAVSEKTAILRSGNMSVGVNLLLKLLKEISAPLYEAGFDTEIVEKHHNQKMDAPSGTALMLAEAVKEARGNGTFVTDRTPVRQKRQREEIGIAAVRGGSIVGDHDVIFAGEDEVITLSHRAYSRAIFAKGAVAAAKFLAEKKNGLYSMQDIF